MTESTSRTRWLVSSPAGEGPSGVADLDRFIAAYPDRADWLVVGQTIRGADQIFEEPGTVGEYVGIDPDDDTPVAEQLADLGIEPPGDPDADLLADDDSDEDNESGEDDEAGEDDE